MTIILDLDDVLANLRESLYQVLGRATGIERHWRDWQHYDLRRHYQLDSPALDALLVREQALEACQPEPGAAALTQALAALGLRQIIVTARGWHPRAAEVSRAWLAQHGMVYDDLRVVPLGGNKLEAIQDCPVIQLAVDDHPRHVARYQQQGIPVLIMDRPWNQEAPGERVYSAVEMLAFIRAQPWATAI